MPLSCLLGACRRPALSPVCVLRKRKVRIALLRRALRLVTRTPAGVVDWTKPGVQPVYRACLQQARLAHALAQRVGEIDADMAWLSALLTPLGWLAVSAVDPRQVQQCSQDAEFPHNVSSVQERCWGYSEAALSRRMRRRWRLPNWLSAIIANAAFPADVAESLGAEPRLLRIVSTGDPLAPAARQCPSSSSWQQHCPTCYLVGPEFRCD